jgi:hypothetical protein
MANVASNASVNKVFTGFDCPKKNAAIATAITPV